MVQKPLRPGRPLTFAREEVLEEIVRLFWEQGYEGVSMKDLEDHTRLNRSSLYNSFGSKEALFAQALDRYISEVAARLLVPLEQGTAGIDDILSFVEALREWFSTPASGAGCLMINSMVEFAGTHEKVVAEACHYTDRFRAAATAALGRAVERDEFPRQDLAPRVDLLLGMILALNVGARSGVPGLAKDLVDALGVQVQSWKEEGRRDEPDPSDRS